MPFKRLHKGSHHGRKAAYLWTLSGRGGGGGLTNSVPFGVIFVCVWKLLTDYILC